MKQNRYKILVLSDLKETTDQVLKSTAGLAEIVGGDITLFHVKKPIDVIERESQLSAFRTINEKNLKIKRRIERHANHLLKEHNKQIGYKYTFGNVKNEIEEFIKANKPDIIVLGKRNAKSISLIGDNITDFVLKTHKGIVMIVGNENTIEPNQELSIAALDGKIPVNIRFAKELLDCTTSPLKSFKFVNKGNDLTETVLSPNLKTEEYVFERNENTVQNFSNYLLKKKINLLLIDGDYKNEKQKEGLNQSDIKSFIKKTNVSLLISNN